MIEVFGRPVLGVFNAGFNVPVISEFQWMRLDYR